MLEIHFEGRFQCRLATDPDAYNHPRGQDGWTFALPGEPDLDRIIRFDGPDAPRSRTPGIGVRVTDFRREGVSEAASPLMGMNVELADAPVFEGRNGQIATSAKEPIVPFTIRLAGGGWMIGGHDPINLALAAERIRRAPKNFDAPSAEVAEATGVSDPLAYRSERRVALAGDLALEADGTRREALARRIAQLGDDPQNPDIRSESLTFQVSYDFGLRGPNQWSDPGGVLGAPPPPSAGWRAIFWMGGWDADALCGFIRGSLRIG